ncbi:TIGR04104 family putative zinc finger protein [Priestia koreensis]|uniref:TIGR04104 family putative zinc finger protein n=1 Tax=Priestia koreensis TaxID=284581 RepID=UPI00203DE6B1|nr:TIGR04104 family putative zinc finger protein [Priestia koreensis]MCM3004035.1 hypothetical protein [Priestia koreensis]
MPCCQNCGHQWSWGTTLKKIWTFKRTLTCPNCQVVQYVSKDARFKISLISTIIPLVLVPLIAFGFAAKSIVFVEFLLLGMFSLYMPNLYELTNEEEHLW